MHTHASKPLILSLSLFGILACGPGKGGDEGKADEGKADEGGDDGGPVVHEQPCPDPARATPPSAELCPPGRQIVQANEFPDCPAPGPGSNWVVDELFAESTPDALNNFCRYIWTGAGAPVLADLPDDIENQTTPDCRVFVQSPLAGGLGPSYQQSFLAGVQPVPNVDALLGVRGTVDIAVVDTAPANMAKAQADHGPAIAAIIAAVSGGCMGRSSECRRRVATVLGLPQTVDRGANLEQGGYFGYQSDLAQGIATALEGWNNKDFRLIINLSVGWEPSTGDLDVDGHASTATLTALQQVIQLARCQGALVVAASGNQPIASCVDQPTGPGSWERQAAPVAATCNALGVATPVESTASYRPLVYAATPLDWQQRNLADFRPGSDARLATLGFGAYVTIGNQSYGPLSGSSISAATISGIAALVWSYFPRLNADEVMEVLYASGTRRLQDGQAVTADFALTQTPEQRVITACGALAHACDTYVTPGTWQGQGLTQAQCDAAKTACADTYSDDLAVRETAWWTGFRQALDAVPANQRIAGVTPAMAEQDCVNCGATEATWLPRTTALPASAMPDPWVLPQPEIPPCPWCQIQDDDIYLGLAPDYSSYQLVNVSVQIYDAAGTSERRDYGALHLETNSMLVVADSELQSVGSSGQPPVSARVTMIFTDPTGRRLSPSNSIPVSQ
ncbi:S8 family serine peptidase [Nannocystaceae bacterium ST9]